ncbi:hypothetical protein BDV98DRAFT_55989 [Pterulicium gracile]|uniref:Uncharacterized protein n=1 Tax=Pterulicium gracile TaxID=1884261 RepID=A0A5C3QJX3_9AGAR|nr:hypothetical protein BDV98DRAFT_55989 [Pterula gracilis]
MGLSKLCHILGFMRLVNSAIVPGPSTSSANASTTISETREELEKLHAVELVGADSEQGRTNVLKVTVLEATEINAFKPYTFYAGAAHCNALVTATWRCGRESVSSGGGLVNVWNSLSEGLFEQRAAMRTLSLHLQPLGAMGFSFSFGTLAGILSWRQSSSATREQISQRSCLS